MPTLSIQRPPITSPLLALLFLGLYSSGLHAWTLQSTDDSLAESIQIWTQPIEGSDFKAFRGEVVINAPAQQILSVIRDTKNVPEWYYRAKETKQLKRLSDQQTLNYSVTDLPWPVTDRDSVILATVTTLSTGETHIDMTGLPDAYPIQANRIRIPKLKGHWLLTPLSADKTRVRLEIASNPGGEIPSWLANAIIIDMPLYSLSQLKERVEQLNKPWHSQAVVSIKP